MRRATIASLRAKEAGKTVILCEDRPAGGADTHVRVMRRAQHHQVAHKPSRCNALPIDPDFFGVPEADDDSGDGVHRLRSILTKR